MKIAVDLDGVIYEWSKTVRYMMREYRGHAKDGPMSIESTYWNYIPDHVSKEDWDWLWDEGIKLGLFRYGHVVTGAQTGIRALRAAGHKLYLVTHRPQSAVPDTIDWLSLFQSETTGVRFDGVTLLTNEEPKTVVQADILIDDKPENVWDWAKAGRVAVIFTREWNRDTSFMYPGVPGTIQRADGWPGVVRLLGKDRD